MKLIYKILGVGKSTKREQSPVVNQNPRVRQYLAAASNCYQQGDCKGAEMYCDLVLEIEPTNAVAYRIRGVVKHSLLDSAGAESDLRHALALG
jgi:Flp pilus assembly protein TadD